MAIETITVTITLDHLKFPANRELNNFISGCKITQTLLKHRIPVIGTDGILGVERGQLTVKHEDGLDGDEWHFTFVGEPIRKDMVQQITGPNGRIQHWKRLDEQEAAHLKKIAEDDEL